MGYKKKQREFIEQAFPVEYVANGMNGTEAYKTVKKSVKNDAIAATQASRLLSRDNVQERILALLPSEKTEAKRIRDALKNKPSDPITWRDQHKFLETSLKLKGLLKGENTQNNVQINFTVDR